MGGGPATKGYRSVAYYVNWAIYGRKHFPWEIPAENLTHVLYAFANIRPETGEVYLTDSWADEEIHWIDQGDKWVDGNNLYGILKQLNLLKRRNRQLKVLLSIGGWTYSDNFRQPASTPEGRAMFANTSVAILKDYGFDGLDIDWEYPRNATEAADWVALLKACREELDGYSQHLAASQNATSQNATTPYHFELTVASPAGPQNYEKLDLAGMDQYLDFWNLMAYDYAGSWDRVAGHSSNLYPSKSNPKATPYSTAHALEYYTRFVDPSKMVVGMPLYGRSFENTLGLGHPYNNSEADGDWEVGVYDFKSLPLPGARVYYDHESGASYSYDSQKKILVSHDTVPMVREKASYIKNHYLSGAMWWETSGDRKGNESVILNVVDAFGGNANLIKQVNLLEYPESKWDNLRNGFKDG